MMNVWEAIQQKRAVRHYKNEQIPEDAIMRILNAGRRSQSSKNTQPWHFIAIQDQAMRDRVSQLGNFAEWVKQAPLVIAIVTPNVEADRSNWIAFDIGQAAAYMQLAAQELGIGSVIGRLHRWEQTPEVLGFPEDMRCDVVLGFGYPTEDEQQKPRNPQGRRPLDDIVHWEKW
jgi:nitroreductase